MDGQGTPVRSSSTLDHAWGWFRLVHPFPSTLVTAASGVFAQLAMRGQAPPDRLARLILSVACSQFAIGSANDVMDRALDAGSKPWKPLVRESVSVEDAKVLAVTLAAACLALSASLGPATLTAATVGLGCGLAYDLHFKRSAWSWLPYGLAIPTLPIWSWAAMGRLTPRLLPVYPLGLLLGLSLHLANTLPDLEEDRAFGVLGLAHGLGRRRSLALCWSTIGLAQAITVLLAPWLRYRGRAYPLGLTASLTLVGFSMILYRIAPTQRTLQINFGVLALACLALAAGWLEGGVSAR